MKIATCRRRALHGLLTAGLVLAFSGLAAAPAVRAANDEEAMKAEWQDRYKELSARVESLRARYAELSRSYRKSRQRSKPRGDAREDLHSELERIEQELAAAEQELADFPDDAHRAGALPGWFR